MNAKLLDSFPIWTIDRLIDHKGFYVCMQQKNGVKSALKIELAFYRDMFLF